MTEEQLYQKLAEETVPIDEFGGWQKFADVTSEFMVAAGVKQRRFERYLDAMGEPGGIRFDPFAQELELRGHVFRGQLLGSVGNEDWLWSHRSPFLDLSDEATSVARQVADRCSDHGFARVTCIEFPGQDRMQVAHRFAALPSGLGLADAYYIANDSQCYAITPGQIPVGEETISDLNWVTHNLLISGAVTRASIERAIGTLSLDASDGGTSLSVSDREQKLDIEIDELGHVVKLDLSM